MLLNPSFFSPFFFNLKHAFQVLALYKYKPFIGKILYVSPLSSVDFFYYV